MRSWRGRRGTRRELATEAEAKAAELKKTIEREYYLPATESYAFSYEGKGEDG